MRREVKKRLAWGHRLVERGVGEAEGFQGVGGVGVGGGEGAVAVEALGEGGGGGPRGGRGLGLFRGGGGGVFDWSRCRHRCGGWSRPARTGRGDSCCRSGAR